MIVFVRTHGLVMGALLLTVLLLLVGSRWYGQPAVLWDDGSCRLPCWRGIVPGTVSVEQADVIMAQQGYTAQYTASAVHYTPADRRAGCRVRLQQDRSVITATHLSECPGLRLGDVMALFGAPEHIAPNLLTLEFAGGTVNVQLYAPACGEALSPFTPIQFISLTSPEIARPYPQPLSWQGFALPWRYRQRLPGIIVLGC
jgi:hypothetical protein